MATENTTDDNLRLILPTVGSEDGTWGGLLNVLVSEFERAVTGLHSQAFGSSDITILADGTAGEAARKAILVATGILGDNVNFIVPNKPKIYIVFNDTTGASWTVGIKTSGGSRLDIPRTETQLVWCDGADVIKTISAISTGTIALANNSLQLGGVVAANFAQKAVLNQWTKPQVIDPKQVSSLNTGDTPDSFTPDANVDTTVIIQQGALAADGLEIKNPTNSPLDGQVLIVMIEQHASVAVSVTWGSDFIFPDDTNVDLTQTANKVDVFSFMFSANLSRWVNFGTALNLPRS